MVFVFKDYFFRRAVLHKVKTLQRVMSAAVFIDHRLAQINTDLEPLALIIDY